MTSAKKKSSSTSLEAWAAELGAPSGTALAAGPVVTKASFDAAQRLVGALGAPRSEVLALAASLDALPRAKRGTARRKVA